MNELAVIEVVEVAPGERFAGLGFTRSKSGHIHSPWWSYYWKKYNPHGPYQWGSHFHSLKDASVSAFSSALGVDPYYVVVSVRTNPIDGQLEWRCGTAHPHDLPKLQSDARKQLI